MHHFDTQPAYILHGRPYRETSLIVELMTKDHGRVSVIAKGVRAPKAKARGLLQPFVPLLVSGGGRGELLLLKSFESAGPVYSLQGRRLVSGFYLNELLMRLLHKYDPHPDLFQNYQETLRVLAGDGQEQMALRLFEKKLLKELGYALQLTKEANDGSVILEDELYSFEPEQGPFWVDQTTLKDSKGLFKGKSLLALANEQLDDTSVLSDAKRLLRQALAIHLGPRPLESRKLLV